MNKDKEKIREKALKHRNRLSSNPDASEQIAQRFFESVPDLENKIVALYWPIKSEMDTSPLMEQLLEKKSEICLPHTGKAQEPLVFLKWDGQSPLVKSGFGTYAPKNHPEDRVIPDIMIVPLVAFDRYGMRLGYGQGHYDRTICALKKEGQRALTIGYAFDQQLCLFPLPKEDHDQRLDIILTPLKIY